MSHDNFQPPDPEEEPEDDKWERWFAEKEKNGYAVLSRDEWSQRLDEVATDGYAEGRKDQREESDARIKELREALEQTSEALALRLGTNAAEWPAVNAARAALAKED